MKASFRYRISVYCFVLCTIFGYCLHASSLSTLYARLDPKSISQHLALYQLYPHSHTGKLALQQAWRLLAGNGVTPTSLGQLDILQQHTVGLGPLLSSHASDVTPQLSSTQIELIDCLARNLFNRKLKGFRATSDEAVRQLPAHEIDLARGLFLSQTSGQPDQEKRVRSYEAMLDLMALQILARLPPQASDREMIQEINRLVFEEMNFRFPPHSIYAKDIDLYTYLPSVLDSRRGVCLGVSILYACLGQRLNIPLELVTPPGHIFVQYRRGDEVINIETTLRGVHVDTEEYLGLESKYIPRRSMKDAIGLAHINEASIYLQSDQPQKAVDTYLIARRYLPDDPLLTELLGYAYLFNGQEKEAHDCLKTIYQHIPDHSVTRDSMAEDYILGHCTVEDIKCIFQPVDASAQSLRTKKAQLETVVDRSPRFRAGWMHLATTLLQLHRQGEALPILEQCHRLDANQPTVEYFLAVVAAERFDFNKAWNHLQRAEQKLFSRDHHSPLLERLRRQLFVRFPIAS